MIAQISQNIVCRSRNKLFYYEHSFYAVSAMWCWDKKYINRELKLTDPIAKIESMFSTGMYFLSPDGMKSDLLKKYFSFMKSVSSLSSPIIVLKKQSILFSFY